MRRGEKRCTCSRAWACRALGLLVSFAHRFPLLLSVFVGGKCRLGWTRTTVSRAAGEEEEQRWASFSSTSSCLVVRGRGQLPPHDKRVQTPQRDTTQLSHGTRLAVLVHNGNRKERGGGDESAPRFSAPNTQMCARHGAVIRMRTFFLDVVFLARSLALCVYQHDKQLKKAPLDARLHRLVARCVGKVKKPSLFCLPRTVCFGCAFLFFSQ